MKLTLKFTRIILDLAFPDVHFSILDFPDVHFSNLDFSDVYFSNLAVPNKHFSNFQISDFQIFPRLNGERIFRADNSNSRLILRIWHLKLGVVTGVF